MRLLFEIVVSLFLEGSQSEKMPKPVRVLGLLILTLLAAVSLFALALVAINPAQGLFRRLICLLLFVLVAWYYIDVLKKSLRRTE